MLSIVQTDAYCICDDVSDDILEKALRSAQAALEAAPTNALSYHVLARVVDGQAGSNPKVRFADDSP